MRRPPDISPPEEITHRQLELIEQTREYQLITPLYGGGVTPGEADPVTIIRATEIRGHLRFWWRATRGGQFGDDLVALKKREGAIWGEASQREKEKKGEKQKQRENNESSLRVQIEVAILHLGESKKPFNIVPNNNGNLVPKPVGVPGYAAFPLRPPNEDLRRKTQQQITEEMRSVQHNVRFVLTIIFPPTYEEDIQAALWAWETFGGLGARTRRGFGALQLLKIGDKANKNLPPANHVKDIKSWLEDQLKTFVVPGTWPKDVPHLEQNLAYEIVGPPSRTLQAWDNLIERYVLFRQSRTKGTTGRSNWPEAEAIRDITGRRFYKKLNHPEKFPRAVFGLPILFHFKDKGDPGDTTLQGANEENERLASPLILRPLACIGGSAVGLAVLLKGSHLPPLVLRGVVGNRYAYLNKSDLAQLPELNYQTLKGETDILQAFLNNLGGKLSK